ncbi:Mlo-related protein [Dillenia turbinata]|uniref:MLO-like protein n=1 Tax=Dillenia turbinata TaxID=194707 RepID=A0AAN8W359_9MAGN
MAAGGGGERGLQETPTWAIAIVCAILVVISIIMEHGIHSLGKWFQKKQKKAMSEALEKIKAELMLLGFISLLLTFATTLIPKICISPKYVNSMLPCKGEGKKKGDYGGDERGNDRRRLLFYAQDLVVHRALAAASGGTDYCAKNGKVSLISQTGVHQLHIFIFALAVFHVLYSIITIALAQLKMKKWKRWEMETSSLEYQFTNDPARFRFAHQTSFVRRHTGLSQIPGIRWIVAFFRQFLNSVSKADYLTMRRGFINVSGDRQIEFLDLCIHLAFLPVLQAHFAPDTKFDFHKYIKRSMEDDFKVVVGISFPLWMFAIIFLLLNVYQWYTLSWMSFAPLIILLLVGTKLELIIMDMAQQIQNRTTVIKGAPIVEPSNKYFWFNRPDWILLLLHFTLFEYEFGVSSCFHENLGALLARVILGVALQFICSYVTFPLYALVTQMGSHMKQAIFEEQTKKAIMKWRKLAKDKKKLRDAGKDKEVPSGITSSDNTPSHDTSPLHLLHKHHHHHSSSTDLPSVLNSPTTSYPSDTELSEIEGGSSHNHTGNNHQRRDQEAHTDDGKYDF